MTTPGLRRELGLRDAVVVGLGAMLGAGVFGAVGPAAAAVGPSSPGLLAALALAALVATCNATSTARLAGLHPLAGGAYAYGRRELGEWWGFAAGWAFVVGKTASCAAIALVAGAAVWPEHPGVPAAVVVVLFTALTCAGVQRTARVTAVLVAATLAVLAVSLAAAAGGGLDLAALTGAGTTGTTPLGVLQAAGLLFFAFAGYARIATLGEEVRDPQRTIGRAVAIALVIVLVVYAAVVVVVLGVLGTTTTAASPLPLRDAVAAGPAPQLAVLVTVGAAVAALGSLLTVMTGVGRTALAMARDRELPSPLAAISPRSGAPAVAQLVVGAVVVVLVLTTDLRGAIAASSTGVLVYYAVANLAAWVRAGRDPQRRLWERPVAVLGLAGCLGLVAALPPAAAATGLAVLAAGLLGRLVLSALLNPGRRAPGRG
ncbi:amino acid/polyamine/organocation transporter, APC superfamily [Quadrisphaera granulorum]|uniref:Amino acid/polyamine/organocation transporter (APC superfamily) n=1 Tax=Quadrisphaera granulorum TaxID=317664 RepID=A0A316A7M6_9ACTN|nr:APC family permease [Quadrisphaera granulorum]PWJ53482.1 amino acid/polyamine/organocation transporter (APC superfamily) [Quadrisphaera granulorum]SZE96824.1 amino acid/polyamine/organocation transporter, APC superfamily [Quadrisphaera granulorum]